VVNDWNTTTDAVAMKTITIDDFFIFCFFLKFFNDTNMHSCTFKLPSAILKISLIFSGRKLQYKSAAFAGLAFCS